jgi:PAS domain S-box-containing protein
VKGERGGVAIEPEGENQAGAEIAAALQGSPVPAALVEQGRVTWANPAFGRAVGLETSRCARRELAGLLPPGMDVRGVRHDGAPWLAMLEEAPPVPGPGTTRALLDLSRELAQAHAREDVAAALARALSSLFPGRAHRIRLLDPKTLAPVSVPVSSRPSPDAPHPIALRRAAVRHGGLSEAALESGGVRLVDVDEPVCEGCVRAVAVPLAVGSQLYGVVSLEYPPGAPGDPAVDEPLLLQVTNPAALGVRNLKSVEELTFLKTYLEELLENANALIVVTNRQHQVLVFNRAIARLTGFGIDEALGADLLGLLPAAERERTRAIFERSIAGEAVTGFETRLALSGGGEALVAFHTAPIVGHGGDVEGVIAIGQDLTALRAMEQRAEHFQRLAAFGRLAAGIVHELNNPLVAVVTYSDHLLERRRGSALDPGDAEKLRRIRDAGERIQRLARDLITYARPSADRPEPLDLGSLLDQVARMCDPALRDARARLRLELEPAPRILGGRASLLQVFVNLVTNAAHALPPEGGTVTLGLSSRGEEVVARISDDGRGMPPEVRARIFEPFFSTKEGGRGVGLGLSIVQGIVARHGGSIEVASEPGQGTTFTVTLPVRGPDAWPDQETSESTP